MALRISVDLDGLRWADLFRFVELARNGGVAPVDLVDVRTFGTDGTPVSLAARIFTDPNVAAPAATTPPGVASAPPPAGPNGTQYVPFDRGSSRISSGLSAPQVDSAFVDEFPRLEDGLVRPGRRGEDPSPERS